MLPTKEQIQAKAEKRYPRNGIYGEILPIAYENGYTAALSDFKAAILEWISVEDRLPDISPDGKAVQLISYGSDGSQFLVCPVVWVNNNFYLDITFSEEGTTDPITKHITHWMPLPKPPISITD